MKIFSGIQNLFSHGVIGTVLGLMIIPFGLLKTETPVNATTDANGIEESDRLENLLDREETETSFLTANYNDSSSWSRIDEKDDIIAQDEQADRKTIN